MTPSSREPAAALAPAGLGPPSDAQPSMAHAEAALLGRLRAGDDAAFEELVRAHGSRLLAVARRMLRNEEDAKDAVQQAFLSAFKALPQFNGQSRISTWLHRIVVNTALMRMRTRSRRPEESIEDLLPRYLDDGHHVETWMEWSASVDTLLEQHETRRRVREAIDRLPESYRVVLLLRDIEELDTAEAARALGLSANAVKIRLHRARQALASLLASELDALPGRCKTAAGISSTAAAR
ncbi:MAG TPA: sigma-70 family RNA polymerase sigma factor [Vicinamibacterales bacterium]|nr:sigma-70 family RNA polymerase sigma factor [Vicinamibacterales bacterium]